MGNFLKFLSVLTGSSEETLLNARTELSHKYGKGLLSNNEERRFVFERLMHDMPSMFSIETANRMHTHEIIATMIDFYINHNEIKFVQIFNRVMVYYYNLELGNQETLWPALRLMSRDFEAYIQRYCEESGD